MKRKITAILLSFATALPLFACREKTTKLTAEQTAEYIAGALAFCKKYGIAVHMYMNNSDKMFGKELTEEERQIIAAYLDLIKNNKN